MSRTWKRDDSGRKARGDTLRDKRRNKYNNNHFDNPLEERREHHNRQRHNSNPDYGLDNDMD